MADVGEKPDRVVRYGDSWQQIPPSEHNWLDPASQHASGDGEKASYSYLHNCAKFAVELQACAGVYDVRQMCTLLHGVDKTSTSLRCRRSLPRRKCTKKMTLRRITRAAGRIMPPWRPPQAAAVQQLPPLHSGSIPLAALVPSSSECKPRWRSSSAASRRLLLVTAAWALAARRGPWHAHRTAVRRQNMGLN